MSQSKFQINNSYILNWNVYICIYSVYNWIKRYVFYYFILLTIYLLDNPIQFLLFNKFFKMYWLNLCCFHFQVLPKMRHFSSEIWTVTRFASNGEFFETRFVLKWRIFETRFVLSELFETRFVLNKEFFETRKY